MRKRLRIGINAQLQAGSGVGGIETVLRVIAGFNQLEGDEEYVFIGHPTAATDWLESLLGSRQSIVRAPGQSNDPGGIGGSARFLETLRPIARAVRNRLRPPTESHDVPISDGFYESLGCDVIHFPYQDYVFCKLPSIYNPHDLQHLHFPEYFTAAEIERREIVYRAACRRATSVIVASQFVKDDLIAQYDIEAAKIAKIPWAPPPSAAVSTEITRAEASAVLERYGCPAGPFFLYPAMTWQHKNHLLLLDAIDTLRKRGLAKPHLICTGYKTDFYDLIQSRLRELQIEGHVTFTGMVDHSELKILYRGAEFVIVPSLFEAASGPLLEAWSHRTPVTCSDIPALVEQAGNAASFFNPRSLESMVGAIAKLTEDAELRKDLVNKGILRLLTLTPERTARSYRAVYRQAAGQPLDEEDSELLNYAQSSG